MKTVNRGWLKRQVEAGKMVARTGWRYDEMTGITEGKGWFPAFVGEDFRTGMFRLLPVYFTNSERVWTDDGAIITLMVHSNYYIELKEREA